VLQGGREIISVPHSYGKVGVLRRLYMLKDVKPQYLCEISRNTEICRHTKAGNCRKEGFTGPVSRSRWPFNGASDVDEDGLAMSANDN
jgi:hypothetical protein